MPSSVLSRFLSLSPATTMAGTKNIQMFPQIKSNESQKPYKHEHFTKSYKIPAGSRMG